MPGALQSITKLTMDAPHIFLKRWLANNKDVSIWVSYHRENESRDEIRSEIDLYEKNIYNSSNGSS
jgi:hypothetical protein